MILICLQVSGLQTLYIYIYVFCANIVHTCVHAILITLYDEALLLANVATDLVNKVVHDKATFIKCFKKSII